MKWTEEQKQAIYEKGNNILVAAAAGSGKTAVLVERIINKVINEHIDIDKLLVVTFTNAAASEMRERVLKAIYEKIDETPEDENLQRQITLLNKSSICTIDSFCLDVVRNNFFEIDISQNFRIGDTTEIDILKQEVLEDLFEEKYETENEDFTKLINTYTTYKDDTPLKEFILRMYNYIQSNPFPEKWLKEKIEMFNLSEKLNQDFAQTIWGKLLLQQVDEILQDSILKLEAQKKDLMKYIELSTYWQIIEDDIEQLEMLKANLDSWDKAYTLATNLKFKTWATNKKITLEAKDEAKEVRDAVKASLKKITDKIVIFSSKEANEDINGMYDILKKLEQVILEFGEKFAQKKKDRNIVDFNDVEHFALKILINENGNPTEIAKKYQEKFEEIAIDEYQDSNLVQEYILTSVSRQNNIFMVGDVKQSIYKFRQARPDLFLNKYKAYQLKKDKKENENLKIQLFKNFRSRKEILDFANIIFTNIMSEELGELNYTEEEYLNLGADYADTNQDLRTEIDILNIEDEQENNIEEDNEEETERVEDIDLEAKFVAKRIKQLIEDKFIIYDAKKEEKRNIQYRDIVVLLRSTKEAAPIFEKEILNLDIPVFSDSSSEYLESIEIQTIMSLLKVIDNPMQEIPLVATMRSMIGGFTDNELVQIRLSDRYDNFYNTMIKAKKDVDTKLKQKIETFLDKLEMWRKEQEYVSLDEFIWKIYNDTGYYHYVGLMTNGELRQANLKMLFERAKQFESISFKGLFNFIRYIDKIKTSSKDMDAAKTIGENDNVVRIMSIHKSKGLEFPVVFLAGTGKQFNMQDLNQKILLHPEIGIGVKYIDYDMQIEYDTLSKQAIRNQMLIETLSEEMRVLYVALTRAKEKLIITGYSKDDKEKQKEIQELKSRYQTLNHILLKKYTSYLDWIRLVCEFNNIEELATIHMYNKNEIMEKMQKQEEIEKLSDKIKEQISERKPNQEQEKHIIQLLEYEYPYKIATTIPNKISVTEIKQMQEPKISNVEKEKTEMAQVELPIPKFIQSNKEIKITSAEKGTLIHLCMQKLDVLKAEYSYEEIKELIQKLVFQKTITLKEAEAIPINKVYQFTKSNIWKEMTQAKEVQREKPFYIHIPAKEIYQEDVQENLIVQGIIDLYYVTRNNELILVDFKTDYVENGEEQKLVQKYKTQLEMYKKALEISKEKRVDNIYIYSTWLEKEIRI